LGTDLWPGSLATGGFVGAEKPVPLYGSDVMFFNQDTGQVRKYDLFVFDPSVPTSRDNPSESGGTEPKRVQFCDPKTSDAGRLFLDSAQNGNRENQASDAAHNAAVPTIILPAYPSDASRGEPWPTRFVSGGSEWPAESNPFRQETRLVSVQPSIHSDQPPVRSESPFQPIATVIDMPHYDVPVTAPSVPTESHQKHPGTPTLAPPQNLAGTQADDGLPPVTSVYRVSDSDKIASEYQPTEQNVRIAMRWAESKQKRPETPHEVTGDEVPSDSDMFAPDREQREQRDDFWNVGDSRQSFGLRKGSLTITPYGYLNLSTSYETQRSYPGDFVLYSRSPDLDGGGHPGFQIDPKSSRLGIQIDGGNLNWRCRDIKTSALLEMDFQGANYGGPRNRGAVMLRRAYMDFTRNETRLLLGQEWDVISPLVPQSLNYVPGSYVGNVGYRRAQIRLEQTRHWNSNFSTIWQFAVCDNVPYDFLTDNTVNIANGGWPMFQGRMAGTFGRNPLADCKPVTVGLSGHIGELVHDYHFNTPSMMRRRHETWSANLDIEIPLTHRLTMTSEVFTGTNLSPLLAGIGQGVDLYSPGSVGLNPRSAESYGGWVNLNCKMMSKFHINGGYGIERMNGLLTSSVDGTARDKNQMAYLNGIYHWNEQLMSGLEVSLWRTDWHHYNATTQKISDIEPGKTTRIEFLTRYSF